MLFSAFVLIDRLVAHAFSAAAKVAITAAGGSVAIAEGAKVKEESKNQKTKPAAKKAEETSTEEE